MYIVYIYIHITSYNNFTLLLHLFLEQNILVLNRYVCNFQLQFLHFLETVFHPFMRAFQNTICPDWTCNYYINKLTTLESKPFNACIVYILPSKCCLVHESKTETWDKTAVSRPIFEKIMHLEKAYTFCSELCTVSLAVLNKNWLYSLAC